MTATCMENLELLSALVDGATTAAESQQLRAHLAQCSDCQAAFAAMAGLGKDLQAASPGPRRADFAVRVAGYVRTQLPQPPKGGIPLKGDWRNRAKALWDHPLRRLIEPARRRNRVGFRDFLKMGTIMALPILVFGMFREKSPLMTFLLTASAGLALGLPIRHFISEVALLGSLRRGRCLEEILSAGMPAQEVVDALSTQGLGVVLKSCLTLLPMLLLSSLVVEDKLRAPVLCAESLWLPAVVAIFLVGSYLCQFVLAWTGARSPLAALGGLILAPALLILSASAQWGIPALLLGGLASTLWVGGAARKLAIWALENPERRSQRVRPAGRSNLRFAHPSDNPITQRELTRMSGSALQSVRGLFLWRLRMALLPALWASFAMTQGSNWGPTFWSGVAIFALIGFLRGAYQTLPAIIHERERGTWESVLQTRLSVATFARGWMEVALYTVFLEGLTAIFVLLLFASLAAGKIVDSGSASDGLRMAILAGISLSLVSLLGSRVGLALSATSASASQAGNRLLALGMGGATVWLLAWGADLFAASSLTGGQTLPTDIVMLDAPLASAVLVGTALWLWARQTLKQNFLVVEARKPAPKLKRYPVSVIALDFCGLSLLPYAAAFVCLGAGLMAGGQFKGDIDPLQSSFGFLLLGAIWLLLIRTPLATLCELSLGRYGSLFMGALHGCLAGLSIPVLLRTIYCLAHNNAFRIDAEWLYLPEMSFTFVFLSAGGGMLIGLATGYLALRVEAPGRERRRVLLGRLAWSGTLALSVLLAIVGWTSSLFSNGKDKYPQLTAAIIEGAEKRSHQSLVIPADENGFEILKNMLFSKGPSPRWQQISEVYNTGEGRIIDRLRSAHGREVLHQFKLFLPDLDRALAKPRYVIPYKMDLTARVPNYILMRTIAHGLAALGLEAEQRGDLDEALSYYKRGLIWGEVGSGGGPLIQEMISVALEAIAVQRLLSLESDRDLTRAQYQGLITQIEKTRFKPENLALCLEGEMTMAWRFLGGTAGQRAFLSSEVPQAGLPLPAFYLHYEQAATANIYERWLPAVRALKLDELREHVLLDDEKEYPMAFFTRTMLSNFNRTAGQSANNLTRLEAIRTIAALKLYHLDHHRWPARLQELVGPYLSTAPLCYLSQDRQFYYALIYGEPRLGTLHALESIGRNTPQQLFPYEGKNY